MEGAGLYVGTAEVSSPATEADLACLQETGQNLAGGAAADLSSNIALVSFCMEALPDMLTGVVCTALYWLVSLQQSSYQHGFSCGRNVDVKLPAQAR